jgi:hypothetical protein
MPLEARGKRERISGQRFSPPEMSSQSTERPNPRLAAVLLTGLIVLALALRFWRLDQWSFDSDEIFMLRDSLNPRPTNPRPLLYFLNHYLVGPLVPLNELGLRLLPAVFGVLAIPALYFVSRRLLGTRAALFATLLLTLSPLHVIYSQFARYWSLVFLLSAVYPYAIYIGVRDRNRRALGLGLVTGVLATLAHPVSILLAGGPAIWFLATHLRPRYLKPLWSQKSVRWGALLLVILAVTVAVRFFPMLEGWISQHDKNPGSGQFLLRRPVAPGLKQILYLLAYVEGLTLPLVLTGVVGIYLLWQGRDRFLALFLTSLAIFPMVVLPLISLRTPVSTYYLLPVAPVFFMGAGVFLSRLFEVDWKVRPRWLVSATMAAIVIAAGGPTLLSQYLNGRRYDFRAVAHWLERRLTPGDMVFSDQPVALAHYLRATKVQRLRHDPAPLMQSVSALHQSGRGEALWIVAPAPAHALRTNLKQGGLARWIYQNCHLRNSIGGGRLDFRQQLLQVYRCPPAAFPENPSAE